MFKIKAFIKLIIRVICENSWLKSFRINYSFSFRNYIRCTELDATLQAKQRFKFTDFDGIIGTNLMAKAIWQINYLNPKEKQATLKENNLL